MSDLFDDNNTGGDYRIADAVDDNSVAEDSWPVCPCCFQPVNPLQNYCENCNSNSPINPLAAKGCNCSFLHGYCFDCLVVCRPIIR